MLDPTGFSLLATSIGVDKNNSDLIVGKASEQVFGKNAGSYITKIISDQYKGDVKTYQLNNSIEKLGFNLSRCSSSPEDTVCSSKCKECEDREAHLVNLVRSKDNMNRDLQTRISEVLEEYSPSQKAHIEGLSEKIREQGDLVSSLTSQLNDLSKCRSRIDEKDNEIAKLYGDGSLAQNTVAERNETIAQLERVILQRDSDIYEGKRKIKETNDTLENLRMKNSSHVSEILQSHLEDLARRDIHMKKVLAEKQSLESRIRDLDSRVVSVDLSNDSLLREKKVLEEEVARLVKSIKKTSGQVLNLDSNIISLTQQLEQKEAIIKDLDMEVVSIRNEMEEATRSMTDEMTTLRGRYEDMSDSRLESVKDFLDCEDKLAEQELEIKGIRGELSQCKSSSNSGDKDLEIQNIRRETEDRIKSHEERLSFKSRQYSDLVGEKNALERKLSGLQKSLSEKDEGMNVSVSRILELEKANENLANINTEERKKHEETASLLNSNIYKDGLENARLRGELRMSENSLEQDNTKLRLCTSDLEDKEVVITRLEGVIEEMRIRASEDETFNRATDYIKQASDNRTPRARVLNETYSNLFWIPGTGRSKHIRMGLEPGGNGKVNPKDIFAFWNQAFKNFGTSGPRKINVSSPVDNTPSPVSLEKNEAFKTWLRVRKANSCVFEPTGSSNISKIYAKEFLLWLYIIHLDGLLGDDGEVLIQPGSTSSAFKFSDMFRW